MTVPRELPRRPAHRGVRALAWIIPAGLGTVAAIVTLWALRPRWTECVDGRDDGGCVSGVDSITALAGTLALVTLFASIVLIAPFVEGRMRLPMLIGTLAAGGLVVATAVSASLG